MPDDDDVPLLRPGVQVVSLPCGCCRAIVSVVPIPNSMPDEMVRALIAGASFGATEPVH